jgi:peroxiredoxin
MVNRAEKETGMKVSHMAHRARAYLCVAAILFATLTWAFVARAEFTVGAELPAFSLKTVDGKTVGVHQANGALSVQLGDERMQPRALIIHLLQPDCLQCQAQLQALTTVASKFRERDVVILGISHRGTPADLRDLIESLKVPFPIVMGVDSEIAKRFAAGDTLGIIDARGIMRYAQVGYSEADKNLWEQALKELVAGKPVTKTSANHERLAVGDRLPAIHLASLRSGRPMALAGEGDRIVFRDEDGKESHPRAAIGMFSRYCTFPREEMVQLQKFHENYAKSGLQVFAIAMHPDIETARKLTRELKVTYPVFNGYGTELGKQYAFG